MDFGDFGTRPLSAASEATYDSAGRRMPEEPEVESQQEALTAIEARCLELSTLARRSGFRHIEYLLQIAAQEAAARRTSPKRARTISPGGTASEPRRSTAAEVIA